MNYLAHAFLSFNDPEILTGNMISDFVKGKQQFDFPLSIQKGIRLHRAIDEFTDAHIQSSNAKIFFRPAYRLYAAPFTDIVYDHFLANDTSLFATENDLNDFARQTYEVLTRYEQYLPEPFKSMLPFMKSHNWLYNYRNSEGIRQSFRGLVRRAKFMSESDTAFMVFEQHYQALQDCYTAFFPELHRFAADHLQRLQKK